MISKLVVAVLSFKVFIDSGRRSAVDSTADAFGLAATATAHTATAHTAYTATTTVVDAFDAPTDVTGDARATKMSKAALCKSGITWPSVQF